jgi:hypothetical protein
MQGLTVVLRHVLIYPKRERQLYLPYYHHQLAMSQLPNWYYGQWEKILLY